VGHFDVRLEDEPSTPEAHHYLTNRFRCVRHPHVTSEKHAQSHRMLERLGVPYEIGEVYRVHMTADAEHAAAFLDVIDRYVVTREQQQTFLTSLTLHTRLRRSYFDQIWREIQAVDAAKWSAPPGAP
jgi:hypothetical protein